MAKNNELIRMAKKAADAWRNTDAYYQAAQIIDMLLEELDESALTQPNEELANKIDSVTWYTLEDGEMIEGAPSRRSAWYKANDILSITDKYRRPPEGEEDT